MRKCSEFKGVQCICMYEQQPHGRAKTKLKAAPEPHQLQDGHSYVIVASARLVHPVHNLQRLALHLVCGMDVLPGRDFQALVSQPALNLL